MTPSESLTASDSPDRAAARRRLIKRFGAVGFWFFFLKGCVWLISFGGAVLLALE